MIQYRNYTIVYDPPPIPIRTCDWQFVRNNFDGASDSGDWQGGSAPSLAAAKAAIDSIEDQE